ncbi:MAG: hypothetical protein EXR73_01105 [Myxococcales bacterium]|nr:hypothetical protein [Myxococcales bacterium]
MATSSDRDPTSNWSKACDLFAKWYFETEIRDRIADDFEQICANHPELATELRRIQAFGMEIAARLPESMRAAAIHELTVKYPKT